MDKIANPQFRVMCQMWGVDQAVKAAARMGMSPSIAQIEAERKKEIEQANKWGRVFRPEPKEE